MAKESSKKSKSFFKQPANITILILSLALLFTGLIGIIHIRSLAPKIKTEMDSAKLAVFEEVAKGFIENQDLISEQAIYKMTGYGISDEDNVFYITFDFLPQSSDETATEQVATENVRHGIVYFWPDKERGGYGYAYSYHDDNPSYHPGGEYYKVEE